MQVFLISFHALQPQTTWLFYLLFITKWLLIRTSVFLRPVAIDTDLIQYRWWRRKGVNIHEVQDLINSVSNDFTLDCYYAKVWKTFTLLLDEHLAFRLFIYIFEWKIACPDCIFSMKKRRSVSITNETSTLNPLSHSSLNDDFHTVKNSNRTFHCNLGSVIIIVIYVNLCMQIVPLRIIDLKK